ncbi:TonB-dependent receptor plug domain-containing protein [Carboxylicivirga marina]|uniref:TonB-dependent receptor plug domain-containing protein n=1 Tax=Carboxylicivirga marina TaxID=2800988 RepID=A0ABS1HIG0_9BACT|nr:TonB-dependent receptor plug domain-containing protein [Carboxylicivirga marina]MBK3517275.1 TonB-dependent receptor plug domain-containing protein [Carboxylicivirga marina]
MEVSVASKNSVSINETPGVVTVITKEEIQNSGARDLIDVLSLVPGFGFGMDM